MWPCILCFIFIWCHHRALADGGFLKLKMMKKITPAILITLFIAVCAIYLTASFKKDSRKSKIIDAINAYTDSAGRTKARLILMNAADLSDSISPRDKFRKFNSQLHARMAVKQRLWMFEYKIDSLEMELKKY